MYEAHADPYCYPGTTVLINIPCLRDQAALDQLEIEITTQRADELLPAGRLSVSHFQSVHRHLFRDLFHWAGRFRTVRLEKSGSVFCYPENIASEMKRAFAELKNAKSLRGLSKEAFAARAAHFLAEVNAIHPFREGNGRTQLAFMAVLGDRAGHSLDLTRLEREAYLSAIIQSFSGREEPLAAELHRLIV
jgi:cell filamentation protein